MKFPQERNTFSQFFFEFLISILNFEQLPKKIALVTDVFLEIKVPKNMITQMSKKPCFRGPLDRQQGK